MLSVDEKTSIQALARTQPPLPLRTGRAVRHTDDYRRHGVLDLYAALEVATGRVTHQCSPTHTGADVLRFMRRSCAPTRIATSTSCSVTPRPTTPTRCASGSRPIRACTSIHADERVVAEPDRRVLWILTKQSPSVTDFPTKRALMDRLTAYLRAWNKHPTPFEWTKPAQAIIKSHKRMLDRISTAVH